MRTSRIPLLHI
uniref:Uncharacterized protein n=1 Tax=Rhizophora mucronata TaxID=61149 RepID=A0A2P2IJL8_RHIMU